MLWNRIIRNGYYGKKNDAAPDFNFFAGRYTTFFDGSRIECKVYLWILGPSMAKFESNGDIFYCRVSELEYEELTKEFERMIARHASP